MLAVQALEKRSSDQKTENEALKSENQALEQRIRRLEGLLPSLAVEK
jgi:cell division protein FtsB